MEEAMFELNGNNAKGFLAETFIIERIKEFLTNKENGGNWHLDKTK